MTEFYDWQHWARLADQEAQPRGRRGGRRAYHDYSPAWLAHATCDQSGCPRQHPRPRVVRGVLHRMVKR